VLHLLGRHVFLQDHIGHAKPSPDSQDTKHLSEHLRLVGAEVEDPVGDRHIDSAVFQRQGVQIPKPELHVRQIESSRLAAIRQVLTASPSRRHRRRDVGTGAT